MDARPSEEQERFSSDLPLEAEGFSEEERKEILGHIEEVAARNRINLRSVQEEIRPRKRGSLFPIVVNLLAVLCIAAGVYYAQRYFDLQEEKLDTRAEGYLTAESKIIEEVRRETQAQLEEKEEEIARIREELRSIEQQQQDLQARMEQRIAEREEELQAEMEEKLARERQRLREEGLEAEELERQLQAYRQQQEEELQLALERFREQTRQELASQREELQQERETARQILSEAEREKEELSREAERRVAELREQFQREREELEERSEEAGAELRQLAEQRQQEQLLLDQMAAMYRQIRSALQNGEPERARSTIEDFRELLSSKAVNNVPAIADRRDVELFLLNTLERRVRSADQEEGPDDSLLKSARLVQDARAAVDMAREAEEQGNSYDAARHYTRAIETITAIEQAHESLLEISAERRREGARERASLAEEELAAGNREEALDMLITAAAEAAGRTGETVRTVVDTLTAELRRRSSELERRLEESRSRREELEQRLAGLEEKNARLSSSLQGARDSKAALEQELQEIDAARESLRQRVNTLEEERDELERQNRRARARVEELQQELEEAVDELARVVGRGETRREVEAVMEEYRRLVERNRTFSGSSSADREAAREAFRSFIRSREVRELFPELQPIFERLYGGGSEG